MKGRKKGRSDKRNMFLLQKLSCHRQKLSSYKFERFLLRIAQKSVGKYLYSIFLRLLVKLSFCFLFSKEFWHRPWHLYSVFWPVYLVRRKLSRLYTVQFVFSPVSELLLLLGLPVDFYHQQLTANSLLRFAVRATERLKFCCLQPASLSFLCTMNQNSPTTSFRQNLIVTS